MSSDYPPSRQMDHIPCYPNPPVVADTSPQYANVTFMPNEGYPDTNHLADASRYQPPSANTANKTIFQPSEWQTVCRRGNASSPRMTSSRSLIRQDCHSGSIVPAQDNRYAHLAGSNGIDSDDSEYNGFSNESSEDSERDLEIGNDEVAYHLVRSTSQRVQRLAAKQAIATIEEQLPSKRKRKLHAGRQKGSSKRVHVGEAVPDTQPSTSNSTQAPIPTQIDGQVTSFATSELKTTGSKRLKSPIFHFYSEVNSDHAVHHKGWKPGDKLFRCRFGDSNGRVQRITPSMHGSVTGLKSQLKRADEQMYRLYEILELKQRTKKKPLPMELLVAQGKQPATALPYKLTSLAVITEQAGDGGSDTMEPYDPQVHEHLIMEWIASCDQPFKEVEREEFRQMLSYGHRPGQVHVPSADAIQRRILQMGDDTIADLRTMIADIPGKVALALDGWTSSNQYAFLAIVMHYITEDWDLEEVLIDFREIIGEHSGKNMADLVWQTIETYGLQRKVQVFVADNASNNDTLSEGLEDKFAAVSIKWDPVEDRLRCCPHTIHLSAIELLDAVGAIKKKQPRNSKNITASGNTNGNQEPPYQATPDNYQESVMESLSNEADNIQAETADPPANSDDAPAHILSGLEKIRKIVRLVRSSPQRKRQWLDEVHVSLQNLNRACDSAEAALVLILDVATRWSSTHQMLRRALKYKEQINIFLAKRHELRHLELSSTEWDAIKIITDWLLLFRQATEHMSSTKQVTLSAVHAVFHSLQDHLKASIRKLPDDAPAQLRTGLIKAYTKLADYHSHFDQSPYYLWACLLDPRIGYQGLLAEANQDENSSSREEYLRRIEDARTKLKAHYLDKYLPQLSSDPDSAPLLSSTPLHSTPVQFDFFASYAPSEDTSPTIELDEFFKLRPLGFSKHVPLPLHWWRDHQVMYPNVSRLARDILTIPGSAVAVERVFLGGRDTISLRRASLKPETIRKLMIIKHKLLLARRARLREEALVQSTFI